METDADRLRRYLAQACLSQRAFAERIGVSPRDVRYWCAGREIPAYALLAAEHLATCPATAGERHERIGWTAQQLAERE